MERRKERLGLVMQWLGKNPNVAHYFAVKIPDVFKEIESAIIEKDNLYGYFASYARRFVPISYVNHIIFIQLKHWLDANGSY